MKELICHFCGTKVPYEIKVMRDDECPKCARALRSCLNCGLFDESANNKCRESQAEWVPAKEKGNFCEYFSPGRSTGSGSASGSNPGSSREQSAREALKNLFREKP